MATICDSLTDAISDWLNIDCVRGRFVTTSFFFVAAGECSRSFCDFWYGRCEYLFISERITVRIFLQLFWMAESFTAVLLNQFWSMAIFGHKHFTRQCSDVLTEGLNIGSRPSDHYFRSVCWFVCLFVCAEFFSAVFDPISIKLGHMLYVWV